MNQPTKKPEVHSPLPLALTDDGDMVEDANGKTVLHDLDYYPSADSSWFPLIVRRVNSGPYVDKKLALADELTVIALDENTQDDIYWWQKLKDKACQYQSMQEEKNVK